MSERLALAMQKSGRLSESSQKLLLKAGIDFSLRSGALRIKAANFPLDLMLVRDDDIPDYVARGVCDVGIVGKNLVLERGLGLNTRLELGFSRCRLAIAALDGSGIKAVKDFAGKRIATSYPESTRIFFENLGIQIDVVPISGSVEITPALGIADGISDLVSTGATLKANNLLEIATIYQSEALLVSSETSLSQTKQKILDQLLVRFRGVLRAEQAKYIMMNAPSSQVEAIRSVIPGLENPTIMPLSGRGDRVALHAVASEPIFWETMERIKALGGSSILVVPIEKIID